MACGATLSLKRSLDLDPVHDASLERSFKRRRCMPMTMSVAVPPTKQHQINKSPFTPVSSKITSEQIVAQVSAQLKRMQRRKQLTVDSFSSQTSDENCPASSAVSYAVSNAHCSSSAGLPRREVPVLTLQEAAILCERMIREKEEEVKSEYEQVLCSKRSEQYETFLMFNHDELNRQYGETAASYVS